MGARSLFSGVAGLRNFQQQLDIIGNNIANSNTPGYKASRVTFQDLLSQTLRSATQGTGAGIGGTNPQQIGLGSTLGAIDVDSSQGNLLVTGRITDMAIQGKGYFSVSDGSSSYYTRAGAFNIDEVGYLVSTTNGFKARGYNANAGVLETVPAILQIPIGIVIDAQPTTTIDFVGNLDAGTAQVGTIQETTDFLGVELTADDSDMEGLYANGNLDNVISGLANLTTTVTVSMTGSTTRTYTYTSTSNPTGTRQFNSLADLAAELETDFGGAARFAAISVDTSGQIEMLNCTTDNTVVSVSSNNTSLNAALQTLNDTDADTNDDLYSDEFSHDAEEADLLVNLRNNAGTSLGIIATDVINIAGDVGGTSQSGTLTVIGTTTLAELCNQIQTELGITNQATNVQMSSLGKLQIYGDGGTDYEIENMDITITGNNTFNAIFDDTTANWSTTQSASDNHTFSFIAYDSVGTSHTVTFKYNIRDSAGGSNQWVWNVSSAETETGTADSIPTSAGSVTFNASGSLSAFSPQTIIIDPQGGIGSNIQIIIDSGTPGATDGLVCFDSDSSARAINGDGYTSGELEAIAINEDGLVTGNFTNGQNQSLAQLAIALFDNPSGLTKIGSNVFIESLNSGSPTEGSAGTGGRGTIIPSALEGANVDLASEFVNLITAQRGYQTNARMITVSDRILQELVNLVR